MTSTRTKQRKIMEELDSYNFDNLLSTKVNEEFKIQSNQLPLDSIPDISSYNSRSNQESLNYMVSSKSTYFLI